MTFAGWAGLIVALLGLAYLGVAALLLGLRMRSLAHRLQGLTEHPIASAIRAHAIATAPLVDAGAQAAAIRSRLARIARLLLSLGASSVVFKKDIEAVAAALIDLLEATVPQLRGLLEP